MQPSDCIEDGVCFESRAHLDASHICEPFVGKDLSVGVGLTRVDLGSPRDVDSVGVLVDGASVETIEVWG